MSPLFSLCLTVFMFSGVYTAEPLRKNIPEADEQAKYEIARAVFDRLIAAKGDRRMLEPRLELLPGKDRGAKFDPEQRLVIIDEAAYDVCMSFGEQGEAALALLLAHELIHYYEDHVWESGFIAMIKGLPREARGDLSGAVREGLEAIKKDEIQADYLGGFLAYSAGYAVPDLMPALLEKLHAAYGGRESATYPSLVERQNLARKAYEDLRVLIDVFEMGNYLVALQKYDAAHHYLQYVAEKFPSREVYNNLGVNQVREAMGLFRDGTIRFVYPLELDLQSRLQGGKGLDTNVEKRERLLAAAIDRFEQAAYLDREYPTARLNNACAHALLARSKQERGEPAELEYYLLKAKVLALEVLRLARKNDQAATLANARVMLGIVAALEGNQEAAKNQFSRVPNHRLAQLNQTVLEQGKLSEADISLENQGPTTGLKTEKIDGIDILKDDPSEGDGFSAIPEPILIRDGLQKTELNVGTLAHSRLLVHQVDGEIDVLLHFTDLDYTEATARGLQLGASLEDIQTAYGSPGAYLPVNDGFFLIYRDAHLILRLKNDKLVEWCIYDAE